LDPTSDPNFPGSSHAPAPRVLKAGVSDKAKEIEKAQDYDSPGIGEVYIGCYPDVIDQHIVFSVLTEGVGEWDIVKYIC
jgi:hypothetical protein